MMATSKDIMKLPATEFISYKGMVFEVNSVFDDIRRKRVYKIMPKGIFPNEVFFRLSVGDRINIIKIVMRKAVVKVEGGVNRRLSVTCGNNFVAE